MKKKLGYFFMFGILSVFIWIMLPVNLELARKIPAFFATVSMISMALSMLISCRFKFIDRLASGMDKAYVWHKWLGIFGLVGASFHWLLVPGPAGNSIDPQFTEIGEEVGQWAMYALLLLGCVSMVKSIPYRIWFYTHKLMGPIFLVSVYHTFFSDVPFEVKSHTGAALIIVSALGMFSWVYKSFFSHKQHKQYVVTNVVQMNDAIEVKMMAKKGAIRYEAGQFAYLDFGFDNIEHFHPFTITSSPQDKYLSFIIRDLGKHTHYLQKKVRFGQKVTVDGAYGQMHIKQNKQLPQVWIAGGIGITPFLSWLKEKPTQRVHIFYAGRGELYDNLIEKVNGYLEPKNVTLHLVPPHKKRLDHHDIIAELEEPIEEYQVFACGPQSMLDSLKKGLIDIGLPKERWKNENFVMR